ncbi:hypothetical protein GC173_18225 [bacterium]|nr:hypothetical protein [bacterium]
MRCLGPSVVMLVLGASVAGAAPVVLKSGDWSFSVEPTTMAVSASDAATSRQLSSSAPRAWAITGLQSDATSASWAVPDQGLRVSCATTTSGALNVTFAAESGEATVTWPRAHAAGTDQLVLASDSGICVPVADPFWCQTLVESEWDTLERLSMPVWGVLQADGVASWMVSTPYRNTLQFTEEDGGGLAVSLTHEFAEISPERQITVRVQLDRGRSPVAPALAYRRWLDETRGVRTLAEKAAVVPAVERLLGAPHVYLWDAGILSWYDIPARQWGSFCATLVEDSAKPGTIAEAFHRTFTEDEWAFVQQGAAEQWTSLYLKRELARAINRALQVEGFHSTAPDPIARVAENGEAFHAAYPKDVLPFREWGDGASLKMLERLEAAGLGRARLCLPGWETVEFRPCVAEEANRRGWLFGTYDSYHSIHDPATAGSDSTWPTAQMTDDLWRTGGIQRRDGSYLTGFNRIGRKLNPLVARPYYEQRVSQILTRTPFSFYFIDCDAYGEVYDDFNPLHRATLEQDATERTRRLGWLASEKGLVVGSEGGNVYAINGVDLLEGTFGPYFGWGDADMKNKDSEFYRGRYFPPDQPEMFFKPIPIKDTFRRRHYDPTVRIPLFQAAFHDAVQTTHHWSNDRFKFPDLKRSIEQWELLWMCPPMVHLNLATVQERTADLAPHLAVWGPLHRRLGFAKMTGFAWLNEDRLVQKTTWEGGTAIVANFGSAPFSAEGIEVPPHGVIVVAAE